MQQLAKIGFERFPAISEQVRSRAREREDRGHNLITGARDNFPGNFDPLGAAEARCPPDTPPHC